jgi:hypothetical protein
VSFRLARLRKGDRIADQGGAVHELFARWWGTLVGRLESQIDDFAEAIGTLNGTGGAIYSVQPHDETLDALAELDATPGLVEQLAADQMTIRAIGTANGSAIPTLADADGRYLASGGAVTASAATTTHKLAVTIPGSGTYYILLSDV